jgi:hypothetical protein
VQRGWALSGQKAFLEPPEVTLFLKRLAAGKPKHYIGYRDADRTLIFNHTAI